MTSGYIYLIREREFVRLGELVYKIGKSKQKNCRRLSSYPKNSELITVIKKQNVDIAEQDLIREFKSLFTHKPEYGNEYFEGDEEKMTALIHDYKCEKKIENTFEINYIRNYNNYNCDVCQDSGQAYLGEGSYWKCPEC